MNTAGQRKGNFLQKTCCSFLSFRTIKGNIHEHLTTVRLPEFITCYQVPPTVNKSLGLEDNYQPCILSQSCNYQSNYKPRVKLAFSLTKHTHTHSPPPHTPVQTLSVKSVLKVFVLIKQKVVPFTEGKNLLICKSRLAGSPQVQNLFETWNTIQGFFSEKTTDEVFGTNSRSFQLFPCSDQKSENCFPHPIRYHA